MQIITVSMHTVCFCIPGMAHLLSAVLLVIMFLVVFPGVFPDFLVCMISYFGGFQLDEVLAPCRP